MQSIINSSLSRVKSIEEEKEMKTLLTGLGVLALGLSATSVYSQVEVHQKQYVNSAPINVEGYVSDNRVSDQELETIKSELNRQQVNTQLNKEKSRELGRLSNQTEKLLDSQEDYIDSKIESQRAIQDFNRKTAENELRLRCILEELKTKECQKFNKRKSYYQDEVQHQAAAPQVEAQLPPEGELKQFEEVKFIPYLGTTNYVGDVEELETKISGGVRLESNVSSRVSVGVGINYSELETKDFSHNYYGSAFYPNYANSFGQVRNVSMKTYGIDIFGKYFITKGKRFRPYVGGGLGYNKMSLKYDNNNPYYGYSYGYSFGNEEVSTSYMNLFLNAGSELRITRTIGLNLELQYSRGFGGSTDGGNIYAPDQQRLNELSDEITNANALSIFAGMVVTF